MTQIDASLLADFLKESLHQNQYPRLTVTSNSMLPLLRRGDQIILESVRITELQPGDIITILHQAQLLTHRYWGTLKQDGQEQLLTRGDRPLQFDAPTPGENLVGRVAQRMRQGHTLSLQAGWGEWLNRRLAQLSQYEWRWFAADHAAHTMTLSRQTSLTTRILRRVLLLSSTLLTFLVDKGSHVLNQA
ncbi:MAG: signal peptidase I [Anaerolineales bacterium]|nr:signal peptidase I [Anaerolineales bacterium]MCB8966404.1 signal peptidase I [Ardenticatenaceae bacterium]